MIKTTIRDENIFDHKTDCLIIHCPEEKTPDDYLKKIDAHLQGVIGRAFKDKRFEGKLNQTLLLNCNGSMKADNVLLAGVGKKEEIDAEKIRQASGSAARLAEKSCFKKITCYVRSGEFKTAGLKEAPGAPDAMACATAEGMYLALYHFDAYKSPDKDNDKSRVDEIVLLAPDKSRRDAVRRAADQAGKVADATFLARNLAAHPANTATPSFLADTARAMARKHGVTCKILGPAEMRKLGMGALLGVARGSHEPPRFIVMEYFGGGKKQAPTVVVGKGVTFDTGGISLKPAPNMDEMKMDMSGAAAAIGLMQAVASLKLPVNVVGLAPATENMPGGSAIKPGDVLTSMSGKTIEVLNTDAEGRLILADALTYAARYKPKAIVDLATLTGACVIALGHEAAAVLSSDSGLAEKLKESGSATGERVWELPLWPEYEKSLKSDIADLKNIAGPSVGAGTIAGAAFLKAFAGDCPWAHLDIAGTAWTGEDKPYVPKGPSGFGVRLLLNYLQNNA
ncbi:MAG: leucyl aminopeptidase [Nitrospinae bacterium]|nr:leucyl aminopeptidase [Nitrospinota bacterium]